MEAVD
jgi:hypothetical protein